VHLRSTMATKRGDFSHVDNVLLKHVRTSIPGCVLLSAACRGQFTIVRWLLEHKNMDITPASSTGNTVWDMLESYLVEPDEADEKHSAAAVTDLLRVMVLRDAPPATLAAALSLEHMRVVEQGARLRARLPAYLTRRRCQLNEHCPLLSPLCSIVCGYEEPISTEDLWATGLGVAWGSFSLDGQNAPPTS
jgi:hypothetical protein